jgi:hypothetical protein
MLVRVEFIIVFCFLIYIIIKSTFIYYYKQKVLKVHKELRIYLIIILLQNFNYFKIKNNYVV